jgi:hypothetical protein
VWRGRDRVAWSWSDSHEHLPITEVLDEVRLRTSLDARARVGVPSMFPRHGSRFSVSASVMSLGPIWSSRSNSSALAHRLKSMVSELEYMPSGFELSHQLSALIGSSRDRVIQLAESATCTCCDARDVDPESRLRPETRPDIVLCRECDRRAKVRHADWNVFSETSLVCEIHGRRVLWSREK